MMSSDPLSHGNHCNSSSTCLLCPPHVSFICLSPDAGVLGLCHLGHLSGTHCSGSVSLMGSRLEHRIPSVAQAAWAGWASFPHSRPASPFSVAERQGLVYTALHWPWYSVEGERFPPFLQQLLTGHIPPVWRAEGSQVLWRLAKHTLAYSRQ